MKTICCATFANLLWIELFIFLYIKWNGNGTKDCVRVIIDLSKYALPQVSWSKKKRLVLTAFATLAHFVGEVGEREINRWPLRQVGDGLLLGRDDLQADHRVFPGLQQDSVAVILVWTITFELHRECPLLYLAKLKSLGEIRISFIVPKYVDWDAPFKLNHSFCLKNRWAMLRYRLFSQEIRLMTFFSVQLRGTIVRLRWEKPTLDEPMSSLAFYCNKTKKRK